MDQRREPRNSESGGRSNDNTDLIASSPPSPSTLISALGKKAWSSPKVKIGLGLWIIGICFMTLTPALVKITPEMRSNYEDMAVETKEQLFLHQDARSELSEAQAILYSSQTWFWRLNPEQKAIVHKNQEIVSLKQAKLNELIAKREEKLSKANAYVGIWSEYGMQDLKERFWNSFEGGKVFAQRQTFWNLFYTLLSSREENVISQLFSWVFMALINFTLGLIGALFYFAYTLVQMIIFYQTSPLSGLAFFMISLLGGASIVAVYLVGLYGLAAGGVYTVGMIAKRSLAVKYEQQQRLLRERQRQAGGIKRE